MEEAAKGKSKFSIRGNIKFRDEENPTEINIALGGIKDEKAAEEAFDDYINKVNKGGRATGGEINLYQGEEVIHAASYEEDAA